MSTPRSLFDDHEPPPPPPSPPPRPPRHTSSAAVIAVVCVGAVAILVFTIFFIRYKKKKNKNKRRRDDGQGPEDEANGDRQNNPEVQPSPPDPRRPLLPPGFSNSAFTYEELASATDGFSDANFLGEGGFGRVHRGLLPNGNEVAVKQLKVEGSKGERDFQAEVDIISRVHHRHLVSLVGYCITTTQSLLVYEFVPNKTLEFHLHGHPKIIHCDIKAANIVLDLKFEAKECSVMCLLGSLCYWRLLK